MNPESNVSLESLTLAEGIVKVKEANRGQEKFYLITHYNPTQEVDELFLENRANKKETEHLEIFGDLITTNYDDFETAEKYVKAWLCFNNLIVVVGNKSLEQREKLKPRDHSQLYETERQKLYELGYAELLKTNQMFASSELSHLMDLPYSEAIRKPR